jgi:hypothetical protein
MVLLSFVAAMKQEREWVMIDKVLNPAVWTMYKREINIDAAAASKTKALSKAAQSLQAVSTGAVTS